MKNYFKHVLKKDQINPMSTSYINLYSRLGGVLLVADLCYSNLPFAMTGMAGRKQGVRE